MSTNLTDTIRHLKAFSPVKFDNTRIDVIGVGATGSRIAMALAKLGVLNLHIWDFDKVESHNIANQIYGINDIGKFKVDALAELIKTQTNLDVTKHNEAVNGRTSLGSVVFLLTDTMSSRKEIWEGAIRYKPFIEVMFETRMGIDLGRTYWVRPTSPDDVKFWESSLCGDDEVVVVSACGSQITVGSTAEIVSGLAVWNFINWFNWFSDTTNKVEQMPKETIFGVTPPAILTRS